MGDADSGSLFALDVLSYSGRVMFSPRAGTCVVARLLLFRARSASLSPLLFPMGLGLMEAVSVPNMTEAGVC